MRWMVDGNNVLGARPDGWWRDRRASARRLVAALGRHHQARGEGLTVVFDGTVDVEAEAEGRRLGVTVLYAPGRRNAADDVIARLVGEDDDPATLTVVTSDQELTRRVRSAGARVLGAGAFRRALDDAPDAPRP